MNPSAAALAALVALAPPLQQALPPDVPAGKWYTEIAAEFVAAGYLPADRMFRPGDAATRAEFATVLTATMQEKPAVTGTPHFDDVPPSHPGFTAIETAAALGLMKGAGNCYGTSPCLARPDSPVNRAEAAALLLRAYDLGESPPAPPFPDNAPGQWYTDIVDAAAGHCLLQGDDRTARVRPGDPMNRAEMITMIRRAMTPLLSGRCGVMESSAESSFSTTLLDDPAHKAAGTLWTETDGKAERTVYVNRFTTQLQISFMYEDEDTVMTLVRPDGTRVDPQTKTGGMTHLKTTSTHGADGKPYPPGTFSKPFVNHVFGIPDPMPGAWTMRLEGPGTLQLLANWRSRIAFHLPTTYKTDVFPRPGEPIVLKGSFEEPALVRGAAVLLRIGSHSFRGDLGTLPMIRAADGHYEAAFTPPAPGSYCFTALAAGETVPDEEHEAELFLEEEGGWCEVVK